VIENAISTRRSKGGGKEWQLQNLEVDVSYGEE
jgi:hypothetical protein